CGTSTASGSGNSPPSSRGGG
ncbi:MAG: hypothetical protein AVDCRST_MAG55-1588, partial [uncultured Rubrobacteraceae bacterium]